MSGESLVASELQESGIRRWALKICRHSRAHGNSHVNRESIFQYMGIVKQHGKSADLPIDGMVKFSHGSPCLRLLLKACTRMTTFVTPHVLRGLGGRSTLSEIPGQARDDDIM